MGLPLQSTMGYWPIRGLIVSKLFCNMKLILFTDYTNNLALIIIMVIIIIINSGRIIWFFYGLYYIDFEIGIC